MKDNQEQNYQFSNPVCKETYRSLPKIYGGNKKQKTLLRIKRDFQPTKHVCAEHQHEEKNYPPTNKKYSKSKAKHLSMPKSERCNKKYCSCNLIHEDQQKTLRKENSKSPKKKVKLIPLESYKPDDFQSLHKVAMRISTQPTLPTGLALLANPHNTNSPPRDTKRQNFQRTFIQQIMQSEQDGNNYTPRKFPRSRTEQIQIGLNMYNQTESRVSLVESTVSKVYQNPKKDVATVQVQVNLDDAIEKRSQKMEEQTGIGTQTMYNNKSFLRGKADQKRFQKLSYPRKSRFYVNEEQEESEQEKDEYDDRDNKQNGTVMRNSQKSASSLSITSYKHKGLNSPTTEFKKLQQKQSQNQSLKASRAKSTKSNGTFRIPNQQNYIEYLKQYRVLDKKNFNIKQLVKKPLFTIVEQQEGVYFGEYDGDIKNGCGINVSEKEIFQGVYEQNVKIKGCQRNIDGVYKGYFVNGKRQGYGTFQWNNGEKFEGNWKEGVKCGFGIWRSPKGDSYEGEWLNNRQHGEGVFKHRNSTYKGEFQNFLKHGNGQQKFVNGDSYVGQYKFGKPDGIGVYSWHQGGKYEGDFKNGIRSGYGKLSEKNGNVYQGQFLDDCKHGEGTLYYKNGEHFIGKFNKNQIIKGIFYKKDGAPEYIEHTQNQ